MRVPQLMILSLVAAFVTAVVAADEPPDPAKIKDKVTITVGKKLLVQFEQSKDELTKPKIVEKFTEEPPTLSLDCRKQDDNLLLIARNPFSRNLKYRALVRHKGRQKYVETSIVPVLAGLAGIEAWQEPIEEFVLFDFKLIEPQR